MTHKDFYPNTFQMPNLYVDRLMALLTDPELRVMLYITRRTLGFLRRQERISLKQMSEGLLNAQKENLDLGVGLKEHALRSALESLTNLGILKMSRPAVPRAHLPPEYEMQWDEEQINWKELLARLDSKNAMAARKMENARFVLVKKKEAQAIAQGEQAQDGAHPGSMAQYHPGSMTQYHPGSMAQYHPGSMAQYHPGSMAHGSIIRNTVETQLETQGESASAHTHTHTHAHAHEGENFNQAKSTLPDWLQDQPSQPESDLAVAEEQDQPSQPESDLTPAVTRSQVDQALQEIAATRLADTQPLPGEYLPGLAMPRKRRSALIAADNAAKAAIYGIDKTTFALMVDAYLAGMGRIAAANAPGEYGEKAHRDAQAAVLGIVGMSVATFADDQAIAKLFKSWKSYNAWANNPPTDNQISEHASRVAGGMMSIEGTQQPTQGTKSALAAGKTAQRGQEQQVPDRYKHMNAFAKPFAGSEK